MKHWSGGVLLALGVLTIVFWPVVLQRPLSAQARQGPSSGRAPAASPAPPEAQPSEDAARTVSGDWLQADRAAVATFRPAYPFWQHIFAIPDGRIVFGSARDGRLLAVFPATGDWTRQATWTDPALARALDGHQLPAGLNDRRARVSELLEPLTGPVLHNPTRGRFVSPNAERYGMFLAEWSRIYERFGVPAEIGLSQAILESGLGGRAVSKASALGFCQWLKRNWDFLNRLTPHVIEAYNQTTQAPYCAAYLAILTTMYGSFIPALSEHHAGGVNVGRTVVNGERLGGQDMREQYFRGSEFAVKLRSISIDRYKDLFRTYGLRSSLYAEMVFGNTANVERLMASYPQQRIFAMRTARAIPIAEIVRTTGVSAESVQRFNPALVRQVPARATLYLPSHVPAFGRDVAFWHRPPGADYSAALADLLRLNASVQRWHEPSFEPTLRGLQRRFEATGTEEGSVMAATLAYVISDLRTSRCAAILEDFRTNSAILNLFHEGVRQLRTSQAGLALNGI